MRVRKQKVGMKQIQKAAAILFMTGLSFDDVDGLLCMESGDAEDLVREWMNDKESCL